MKRKIFSILFALVLLVSFSLVTATPVAAKTFWWESIDYPEVITVGEEATVTIEGLNLLDKDCGSIDLNVCFKACFWWGHWTYAEQAVSVSPEDSYESLDFTFTIPYDLYFEALATSDEVGPWPLPYRWLPEYYYFYVYSPTPYDSEGWGGPVAPSPNYYPGQGAISTDTVIYPVNEVLLTTAIGMIKAKILPPPGQPDVWADEGLNEGLRQSLIAKLDKASNTINKAYDSGKLNRLNGARGMLSAFINELESNNPAASYSKAEECIDFATIVREWVDDLIP